jgi:hypothetical protein
VEGAGQHADEKDLKEPLISNPSFREAEKAESGRLRETISKCRAQASARLRE